MIELMSPVLLNCEYVGMVSTEIMEKRNAGHAYVHVQQSLDEVGDGERFRFILDYAYQSPDDPERFGQLFEAECKKLDMTVKGD